MHSNQLKHLHISIFINAPFPLLYNLYRFLIAGTVFMKILFISRIIIIIIIFQNLLCSPNDMTLCVQFVLLKIKCMYV